MRETLISEFHRVTEKFWENQLRKFGHRKSNMLFPKINSLLRSKQPTKVNELQVHENNFALLQQLCNNANEKGHNYIFSSPLDKLNIIDAHYEAINFPKFLNVRDNLIKSDFNLGRSNNTTHTILSHINTILTDLALHSTNLESFETTYTQFSLQRRSM